MNEFLLKYGVAIGTLLFLIALTLIQYCKVSKDLQTKNKNNGNNQKCENE